MKQLRAEPLCAMCPDRSKRLATVADHVIPHRGDHSLFWFGKLQSLCKSCHDGKKQRAEKRAIRGGVKSSIVGKRGTGGDNEIFSRASLGGGSDG